MAEEVVGRVVLFIAMAGSGVLALWMADAAASGRLGRNQIAGIRTASTLASDEAWLAAHRAAKRPTVWAAWCSIACSIPALLPVPMPVVVVSVLAGAVALLVLVLYAASVGGRAARATSEP